MIKLKIAMLRCALMCSVFALCGPALAESDCDSVLKPTLTSEKISSLAHDQATFSYACTHDFEEFNNTYGGSASGKFLDIGGSGAYSQANYKKLQHDKCNQATSSEHKTNYEYNLLVDAKGNVASDWRQCMENINGFNCWAEPDFGNISVVLNLRAPGSYQVKDAILSDKAKFVGSSDSMKPGRSLLYGKTRIVLSRDNSETPISLTVNITDKVQTLGCRVAIPRIVNFPQSAPSACKNLVGDWYHEYPGGVIGRLHIEQRDCIYQIVNADIGGVRHWILGTVTGGRAYDDVFRTDTSGCTVHFFGTIDNIENDAFEGHIFGTDGKCGFATGWTENLLWKREGT